MKEHGNSKTVVEEIEDLQSKLKATKQELDATRKKKRLKRRELNPSFDWGVGGNGAHQ